MDGREIEVKVLDIKIKETVERLKALGGEKVSEHLFRRITFDFDDDRLSDSDSILRLRTDGKITTLTYKKKHNSDIDGREEHEIVVDDLEKARIILDKLGLKQRLSQENRRVSFKLDGVEVDIDLWPMIPPYMEIEAETKEKLLETLKKIGVDVKYTVTYGGRSVYKHYGINIDEHKDIRLEEEKRGMRIG